MQPTKQSQASYHFPSVPPSHLTVPQLIITPLIPRMTLTYAPQVHAQPYAQTYMEPMQMYQAAHHPAYDQPLHQHVLNPAAQTFIHSTQVGPGFTSETCFPPTAPEAIHQQKSIKELLEEPMPYCDSEYCGGFCRGLSEAVPKTRSQPTVKLPKVSGKKACSQWQPRKFAFFSLPSKVRKHIYRHALFPFQPEGIRRAFQLSVELKTLFTLSDLGGLLAASKAVRLECLRVWIEQVDLHLYAHEIHRLHDHLRPLSVLGSGLGAWNFRRLYFVADINGAIGVRCRIDLELQELLIDLGDPAKCTNLVSVYEHHTYFYPDADTITVNSVTMKNTVSAAEQLAFFMRALFKELVGNKETTKWGLEDIKMAANRFFAVARPAFYNVDAEETKDKWAKFIDPAHRVLYDLDEEWRPRIKSLTLTNEKST